MTQVRLSSPNTQQTFNRKEKKDGGRCEEPLSSPALEGYGYYLSAMIGHLLGRYTIVRKVCVSILAGWHGDFFDHIISSDGLGPLVFWLCVYV